MNEGVAGTLLWLCGWIAFLAMLVLVSLRRSTYGSPADTNHTKSEGDKDVPGL